MSGENRIGLFLDYRADAKCEFVPIVRSYRMSVSKFGSLTINNGRLISLTPEGLGNDKKAHLHRPCLSGEMFLGTKMHLHSNNVQLKFHSLTHSLTGIISLTVFCNDLFRTANSLT